MNHPESIERIKATMATDSQIQSALERMEASMAALAKSPEHRAKVESERVASAREGWNAPRRHLENVQVVRTDGQWGQHLEHLTAKLGNGFTVALIGTRGNGKTQMAVNLMSSATVRFMRSRYTTATDYLMDIKRTYRPDSSTSESDVVNSYLKPQLLVIDEIAKRGETEWENRLLVHMLIGRYNALKDTVIISNQPPQVFIEAIGPSMASRMKETGGIIECNWESFR